jgi:hypothetical protein
MLNRCFMFLSGVDVSVSPYETRDGAVAFNVIIKYARWEQWRDGKWLARQVRLLRLRTLGEGPARPGTILTIGGFSIHQRGREEHHADDTGLTRGIARRSDGAYQPRIAD